MAESAGEKKHEATAHRRQQAREEGQLARSQDLGSALVLMGAIGILMMWGPGVADYLAGLMVHCFSEPQRLTDSPQYAVHWVASCFQGCLITLIPILVASAAIAWIGNWVQIGFLFLPGKLQLDWSHVSPLKGLQRLVSLRNATRLAFGITKIGLVAAVAAVGLWGSWEHIMSAANLAAIDVGLIVWNTTIDMSFRIALTLLVLAILDYGFQRWRFEEDLKMTDEEMREEMKMMNGDPQILARRRAAQRQLLVNRIQSAVPKADVVITNPTELAIAIQFDPKTMPAPIVVAKGAGTVAARIRKMALEHAIPVLERKPLAQALYKAVDIGRPIPVEQYAAVAEVLRYVYQLQGKKLPEAA